MHWKQLLIYRATTVHISVTPQLELPSTPSASHPIIYPSILFLYSYTFCSFLWNALMFGYNSLWGFPVNSATVSPAIDFWSNFVKDTECHMRLWYCFKIGLTSLGEELLFQHLKNVDNPTSFENFWSPIDYVIFIYQQLITVRLRTKDSKIFKSAPAVDAQHMHQMFKRLHLTSKQEGKVQQEKLEN